jgi:uncharacterized membrane protein YccC
MKKIIFYALLAVNIILFLGFLDGSVDWPTLVISVLGNIRIYQDQFTDKDKREAIFGLSVFAATWYAIWWLISEPLNIVDAIIWAIIAHIYRKQ